MKIVLMAIGIVLLLPVLVVLATISPLLALVYFSYELKGKRFEHERKLDIARIRAVGFVEDEK